MARVFDCAVFQNNVFQGIQVGAGAQSSLEKTVSQATDTTQITTQLDSSNTITHGDATKSIKREGL